MKRKIIKTVFPLLAIVGIITFFAVVNVKATGDGSREPAQFPEVTIKNIVSGEFAEEAEEYFEDRFPLRTNLRSFSSFIMRALGKDEVAGVYFAEDGYLLESFHSYDTQCFNTNTDVLKKLNYYADAKGIEMSVMLVPSAVEILSDKCPEYATDINQETLRDSVANRGINTVNVFPILKAHNGEYIYYKTDSNYTSLGAFYCYCAWKNMKKEALPSLDDYETKLLSDEFRGSTYAKVNYAEAEYDEIRAYYKDNKYTVSYNNGEYVSNSLYEYGYLEKANMYGVFLNANQALSVIKGSGEGKLLVIGDSYADCFAQFVAEDYGECHFINLHLYDKSVRQYIRENGITEILVLYSIPNFANDTDFAKLQTVK